MDYEALFPNRFLKAAEFAGRDVTLTISAIKLEDLPQDDGKEKRRGVVSFRETKRQMVLNRTNAECLRGMFTRDTEHWLGKRVTLFQTEATMGRENVLAIRIKGSPDITDVVSVEVKLPKRRPVVMRLVPTETTTKENA